MNILGDRQCQVQEVLVDLGVLWVLVDPLQAHPAEIQRPHIIAPNKALLYGMKLHPYPLSTAPFGLQYQVHLEFPGDLVTQQAP